MFRAKTAFSGFSVNDLPTAKKFYADTLGLKVEDDGVGVRLHLPAGGTVFAYPKRDHQPATFTILNFVVDDIDAAVGYLTSGGARGWRDDRGPKEDEKRSFRGRGPDKGPGESP